jgi:hypothetical protein
MVRCSNQYSPLHMHPYSLLIIRAVASSPTCTHILLHVHSACINTHKYWLTATLILHICRVPPADVNTIEALMQLQLPTSWPPATNNNQHLCKCNCNCQPHDHLQLIIISTYARSTAIYMSLTSSHIIWPLEQALQPIIISTFWRTLVLKCNKNHYDWPALVWQQCIAVYPCMYMHMHISVLLIPTLSVIVRCFAAVKSLIVFIVTVVLIFGSVLPDDNKKLYFNFIRLTRLQASLTIAKKSISTLRALSPWQPSCHRER